MDIRNLFAAPVLVAVFLVSNIANAALVSRLGGLAYYDTEADLTWLADANAAIGSVYDTMIPGSGRMTWADANAWTAGLVVDGVGGWRLADTLQPDASCGYQGSVVSYIVSYEYNCTGSEMGNLFYNVLGNTAGLLSNTGPFSNVQSNYYWSATEYAPYTSRVWGFHMGLGFQYHGDKTSNAYAWAVQSGDVSAVPVPAAVWLFGSGLVGLIGVARCKKA